MRDKGNNKEIEMKRTNINVVNMTNAAAKRSVWRDGLAYRRIRYAGAVRLVPAVNIKGIQWVK